MSDGARESVPADSSHDGGVDGRTRPSQGLLHQLHHRKQSFGSTASPRTKTVTIGDSEVVSPLMLARQKSVTDDFKLDAPLKQYSAGLNKRLSGRYASINSSTEQLSAQPSPRLVAASADLSQSSLPSASQSKLKTEAETKLDAMTEIISQISVWVAVEKQRRHGSRPSTGHSSAANLLSSLHLKSSVDDAPDTSLDKLEELVNKGLELSNLQPLAIRQRRRSSLVKPQTFRKLRRQPSLISSDTEYEGSIDVKVPSCDVVLDNTKTLSHSLTASASGSSSQVNLTDTKQTAKMDRDAWYTFKHEVLKLSHTLRLKGWRRVPLEKSSEIHVERLSGALTNAVYVVVPPDEKHLVPTTSSTSDEPIVKAPRKPMKLLLRVYGPQVEHLIDRESELLILKRLARKRIGPRLLGTFSNGRFEEYFHARTLTAQDLRQPETSKQIAKRMRELHEGVELLQEERTAGPFVWQNWSKWVDKAGKVADFVDSLPRAPSEYPFLVCGTSWLQFRQTVERYYKWLQDQYGGPERLAEQLIFAHNDTQYGNILRLQPPGESPLMLPANEHKQLIVIDFEYANANLPAQEFANHFTEWCYNYHDEKAPYACNANRYPTEEEQHRFIRAYLTHQPSFTPTISTPRVGPVTTPKLEPRNSFPWSMSRPTPGSGQTFDLDQVSCGAQLREQEERAEAEMNAEIARLMYEARLWRVVNSAQWTIWGLVQAHVPGLAATAGDIQQGQPMSDALDDDALQSQQDLQAKRPDDEHEETSEEFDYLSYARERAMFFWGDLLVLGFVNEHELPPDVLKDAKRVIV